MQATMKLGSFLLVGVLVLAAMAALVSMAQSGWKMPSIEAPLLAQGGGEVPVLNFSQSFTNSMEPVIDATMEIRADKPILEGKLPDYGGVWKAKLTLTALSTTECQVNATFTWQQGKRQQPFPTFHVPIPCGLGLGEDAIQKVIDHLLSNHLALPEMIALLYELAKQL